VEWPIASVIEAYRYSRSIEQSKVSPAGVVGRLQPAGDGEGTAFGGVGGREQTSLNLGCEGERDFPLGPLEDVGVASRGDKHVRQRMGGGDQVVDGLGVGGRGRDSPGCRLRRPAR
jgi:hypothetical protein